MQIAWSEKSGVKDYKADISLGVSNGSRLQRIRAGDLVSEERVHVPAKLPSESTQLWFGQEATRADLAASTAKTRGAESVLAWRREMSRKEHL